MNDIWESLKNEKRLTRHYYGDIVRFLFMVAAIIMLITLPFLSSQLPVSVYISIIIILVVGALAGITNPLQKWVSILDAIIAVGAMFTFEFYAVGSFIAPTKTLLYFLTNQLLAFIFLFAVYYSIKTIRAMLVKEKPRD